MKGPDEMGHTHTWNCQLNSEKRKKILELSRLNKRADYDCEVGAAKGLATRQIFTGSDGAVGVTAAAAAAADSDGGSGGGIIFYKVQSLNSEG